MLGEKIMPGVDEINEPTQSCSCIHVVGADRMKMHNYRAIQHLCCRC